MYIKKGSREVRGFSKFDYKSQAGFVPASAFLSLSLLSYLTFISAAAKS